MLARRLLLALSLMVLAGCAHRRYATRPPVQPAPVPSPVPSTSPEPPNSPPPSRLPTTVETPPAVPGQFVEEGMASWYGIPFDGRRTSNGEIYDMHQFTAAHRTLPFGAVLRVTNLRNGRQTEVRINDRGPFVGNRIIDLSLSAAQAIEMVGPGTAQVRIEIISGPNPFAGFFGVQVGAFRVQDNADRLRAQLAMRYSPVKVILFDSPTGPLYRVRVGRVPAEAAANQLAQQLHSAEQLTTFVVRIDEP